MLFPFAAFCFSGWQPHFSFVAGAQANEMILLRWLHLVFGIIWIGLLYLFNLVLTPAMKRCDPKLRIRIYPDLMSPAMGWFRDSSVVTVLVGLRYFTIHLASDAKLAGLKSRLPYAEYLCAISGYTFAENFWNVFDHLVAPTAFCQSRDEVEDWFAAAGLNEIVISQRNKNSWRGTGLTSPE